MIDTNCNIIWTASSEFVSSSIPSWQILTAHAQPFRGARDLAFCLKVSLDSLLVWASSEGSGETAQMRRLAWTFAARIGDEYQIRLTRSICCICWFIFKMITGLCWGASCLKRKHSLLRQVAKESALRLFTYQVSIMLLDIWHMRTTKAQISLRIQKYHVLIHVWGSVTVWGGLTFVVM